MIAIFSHIHEVKIRIQYILVSFLLTCAICLVYWQECLFIMVKPFLFLHSKPYTASFVNGGNDWNFLGGYPLKTAIDRFIFTNLPEAFFVTIKISFIFAIWFTIPLFLYQFYLFLARGLYREERKQFVQFSIFTILSLNVALLFCYFMLLPLVANYFLGFQVISADLNIEIEPRIGEYLKILIPFFLFLIIVFQLPMVLFFIQRIFMLNFLYFAELRPFIYVFLLLLTAFLAPPDVISQLIIVLPPILFYEVYLFFLLYLELLKKRF